jgi:hypothetical protein
LAGGGLTDDGLAGGGLTGDGLAVGGLTGDGASGGALVGDGSAAGGSDRDGGAVRGAEEAPDGLGAGAGRDGEPAAGVGGSPDRAAAADFPLAAAGPVALPEVDVGSTFLAARPDGVDFAVVCPMARSPDVARTSVVSELSSTVGWAGAFRPKKKRENLDFSLAGAGESVAGSAAGFVATPVAARPASSGPLLPDRTGLVAPRWSELGERA